MLRLDDVIIHCDTWQQYHWQVAAVLETLRQVGLTANPKKCFIGQREVQYLGYHLGGGQVRPSEQNGCGSEKDEQLRVFLGMAGYYRQFIPTFVELTSPLTDLTRKGTSDPVQWTKQFQVVFVKVKKVLCGEPLLFTPNFVLPFVLQTDPSNRGLGAVLCCTSAGSLWSGRRGTTRWRKNASLSPYGTPSWDAPSPSVWTMLLSAGSTT